MAFRMKEQPWEAALAPKAYSLTQVYKLCDIVPLKVYWPKWLESEYATVYTIYIVLELDGVLFL